MSDVDKNEIITGYKAFDPDFKCNGYQYEVGKTFEYEGLIRMGSKGFHFCPIDPLDVFDHYPLVYQRYGRYTRFAKVSAPAKCTTVIYNWDRCVTSKINIDEEITLDD